jgi:hypothetical protein
MESERPMEFTFKAEEIELPSDVYAQHGDVASVPEECLPAEEVGDVGHEGSGKSGPQY